MTTPHYAITESALPRSVGGCWLYPLLLAVQTAGVGILCWGLVPLYRAAVNDPTAYHPAPEHWRWSLPAFALIQAGYWVSYQVRPTMPQFKFVSALLGHIVVCLSRVSFLVPSTIFLFAFIAKGLGDQMPVSRRAFFFAELFSFFCYTLELQRLGEALMREKKESGDRLNRN